MVDGVDVVEEVNDVLDAMTAFAERVRSGEWKGYTGKAIRNVVNIGIGGSDLGPVMAYEALRHYTRRDLTFRFVSNVDSTDFVEATRDLSAEETLFIISSKTFTTFETLTNATSARDWVVGQLGDESAVAKHFVAVSTNAKGVSEFGIDTDEHVRLLGLGRWPLLDGLGDRALDDARCRVRTGSARCSAGFHDMDEHFRTAPLEAQPSRADGPARGLVRRLLRCQTAGVMPYDQYLKRFPAYLQQLTMESNGKHVTLDGIHVDYQTGAVYWGEPGTNGQHSFYQLIHQGTKLIPVDLIGFGKSLNPLRDHHDILTSNVFAQAQALAFGKTEEEVRAEGTPEHVVAHRVMEGNRPTNVLLAEVLTPGCSGRSWRSTSTVSSPRARSGASTRSTSGEWSSARFWPRRSSPSSRARAEPELDHDSSTNALIRRYRELKSRKNPRESEHGIGQANAARHDRARPDGCESGPPVDARRAPLRRLRRECGRGQGSRGRRGSRVVIARRLREQARKTPCALDHGPAGIVQSTLDQLDRRFSKPATS